MDDRDERGARHDLVALAVEEQQRARPRATDGGKRVDLAEDPGDVRLQVLRRLRHVLRDGWRARRDQRQRAEPRLDAGDDRAQARPGAEARVADSPRVDPRQALQQIDCPPNGDDVANGQIPLPLEGGDGRKPVSLAAVADGAVIVSATAPRPASPVASTINSVLSPPDPST